MRPNPRVVSAAVGDILDQPVGITAKMLEEQFPATWRRMHTRTIDSPPNYYSSKTLAVGFTAAIEEARMQKRVESNIAIVAGVMEPYDFPTYYVSAPLVEALKRSHPPENLTWKDISLPFPGMCFMVPRGSLLEPEETGKAEIALIGVAKLPAGEWGKVPCLPGRVEPPSEDRVSIFWMIGPSGLVGNDTTFPASHPLEPLAEWIDQATLKHLLGFQIQGGAKYFGPNTKFCTSMAGLVANFILVMAARKELVEHGARQKWVPKSGIPVHSPTFIGRKYEIVRKWEGKLGESRGHFTELGWRSGHWKRQHFGPKNENVKDILVDPYIAYVRGFEPVKKETTNA